MLYLQSSRSVVPHHLHLLPWDENSICLIPGPPKFYNNLLCLVDIQDEVIIPTSCHKAANYLDKTNHQEEAMSNLEMAEIWKNMINDSKSSWLELNGKLLKKIVKSK